MARTKSRVVVHRFEFEIEKSLDDVTASNLGLSIDDGEAILASLQRHFIERQCALYVLLRRHCQGCGGTRPIKDYSTRTIQTVYGSVTVGSPRLYPCRRCMPGVDFTITPVSELCPDRATEELIGPAPGPAPVSFRSFERDTRH